MSSQGNPMVLVILIPVFLAVGIHLLIYSQKRKSMLKAFAQKKGLKYTPEDTEQLEEILNKKLAIEGTGLVRSFGQIKDIVSDGEISLFRCIELLDLNPYRDAANTHQNHICVSFNVPEVIDLFFVTTKEGIHTNLYPKDKNIEENEYFLKLKSTIENNLPKNKVIISFRHGKAVLYISPLVTGGETEKDLEYLVALGKAIKNVLL